MFKGILVSIAALGMSGAALASSVLVQAPIEKVFVPVGFDDNDKVEVIVHGHFTSSCYKMGPVDSQIDTVNRKVLITAEAYYYPGAACVQMIVPFIKSVELKGSVADGTYQIEVVGRPTADTSPLHISKSTRPDADDFLYAGATSATIEKAADGHQEIVIKGQHPYLLDGCIKFEEVRSYLSPSKVLVVQPITKIVYGDECRGSVNNRFEYHAPMAQELTTGEYVMHVRVLDGNSINQFVAID